MAPDINTLATSLAAQCHEICHDTVTSTLQSLAPRPRRTNAAKRDAVVRVLTNSVWKDWNDSAVARLCSVSAPLVGAVRAELYGDSKPEARLVMRNGRRYWQCVKQGRCNELAPH